MIYNLAASPPLDWVSAIGAVAQGLTAIAGFVLSWVIWKGTSRLARVEYMRSIQGLWSAANTALLENPSIARLSDKLFGIERNNRDSEYYQKRDLAFLYLNIIEASFLGYSCNVVAKPYHEEMANDILDPMLRDEDVLDQIRNGGFSSDFVAYCEGRIATQRSTQTAQDVDPDA